MLSSSMKMKLYNEYISGKYREVWIKLKNTSLEIDSDEAKLICQETMNRARNNLEIISHHLDKANFNFFYLKGIKNRNFEEDPILSFNEKNSKIIECSKQTGFLPLSVLSFYELIDEVNFTGEFPWKDSELGSSVSDLDPIQIFPSNYIRDELTDYNSLPTDINGMKYVRFSLDDLMKANVSSGEAYSLRVYSNEVFEGSLTNYIIDMMFSDYLRLTCKWGGFPGLAFTDEKLIDKRLMNYVENIRKEMIRF